MSSPLKLDWKSVAGKVGVAAPVLGTLLGGPAGAAVGALVAMALGTEASPAAVAHTLATDPTAAVKLAQLAADHEEKLRALVLDQVKAELEAQAQITESVNLTMRAEAAAEHWPTYSWRPFLAFLFGFLVTAVYFVLPLAKVPVPSIPESVWATFGAVLGLASFFRGKMQADPEIPTDNKG